MTAISKMISHIVESIKETKKIRKLCAEQIDYDSFELAALNREVVVLEHIEEDARRLLAEERANKTIAPVERRDGLKETKLGEGELEFDGVESSWHVPTTWRSDGLKVCGRYGELIFREKLMCNRDDKPCDEKCPSYKHAHGMCPDVRPSSIPVSSQPQEGLREAVNKILAHYKEDDVYGTMTKCIMDDLRNALSRHPSSTGESLAVDKDKSMPNKENVK